MLKPIKNPHGDPMLVNPKLVTYAKQVSVEPPTTRLFFENGHSLDVNGDLGQTMQRLN